MEWHDYLVETERTAGHFDDPQEALLFALVGMLGEGGEVAELLKKHIWHKHPLDRAQIKGEIGDMVWYLARLLQALGIPLEDVLDYNIGKLRRRYPNGFNTDDSIHRHPEDGGTRYLAVQEKGKEEPTLLQDSEE
jgi:NTP pyrophosphatase (non-canonical NTP hydrolase)